MFNLVRGLLISFSGPQWNLKLLSVATDGARNITGRLRDATRFEEESSPRLFLIWCAAHHLDLIIQKYMKKFINDSFWDPLMKLISDLRLQTNLRAAMCSTCPAVSTTRWISFGRAASCIVQNRFIISDYLMENNSALFPTSFWSLTFSAVKLLWNLLNNSFAPFR